MDQEVKVNKNKKKKLIYLVLIVVILIGIVLAFTYAFYQAGNAASGTTNAIATLDCINITYSETDTIDLDYNYPISDEYALTNVTPVTVKVENHCTNNLEDLSYALTITSLSNETGFISDDKMRIFATKTINGGTNETAQDVEYINNLSKLSAGNVYTNLSADLAAREKVKDYAYNMSYVIHEDSISNSAIHEYKVYLWVDYYEGDQKMYDLENNPGYEHNTSYDNSTEGQNFAAAISLVINPSYEEDYGLPKPLNETIMALEGNGQVVHEAFSYNKETHTVQDATILAADTSAYTSVTQGTDYGFAADTTANTWTSTNAGVGGYESTISLVPLENSFYQLCYTMSSEEGYDYGTVSIDGVQVFSAQNKATTTFTCIDLGNLTTSNTILVKYLKDGSADVGDDQFVFYIQKATVLTETQTLTADAGYRYEGNTVDNYITFNDEVWRIVSVEEGSTIGLESGKYYTKIIKNTPSTSYAYDDWNYSTEYWSDTGLYYYLTEEYYYNYSGDALDETSTGMIVSAKWYYSPVTSSNYTANEFYVKEREDSNKVATAYVGTMYPSDYKYASWFTEYQTNMWTITPFDSSNAWYFNGANEQKLAFAEAGNYYYDIRPVVYLDSTVMVTNGGVGTKLYPYEISLPE